MTEPRLTLAVDEQGLTISSDRFKLITPGDDPAEMDAIISELQTMTRRTYGQYCGLSRALEVVGERWGLLIVRDLLVAPRDAEQLRKGLPMIPAELLLTRLGELENSGVIHRLPNTEPHVYALTEYGAALEDIVLAFGRWGSQSMKRQHPEEIVTVNTLIFGMSMVFQPDAAAGVRATYQLCVNDTVFHVRVEDGHAEPAEGPAENPDLVLDPGLVLRALLSGDLSVADALDQDLIRFAGDPALLEKFPQIFHMPELPGPKTD